MNTETLHTRYPGLRPFSTKENKIFFGRDKEVKELLSFLALEQLIVLFSKSGVGKSSLIYAGLYPKLKEHKLIPVRIRMHAGTTQDTPVTSEEENTAQKNISAQVVKIFERSVEDNQDEEPETRLYFNRAAIQFKKGNPKIWEMMKVLSIPEGYTPLLIFDQFEEFFHFPIPFRKEFMMQLSEVLHRFAPNRVLDELGMIDKKDRTAEQVAWVSQPQVKCLIVIRDDRLADLDNLKDYLPNILRNRYKLFPMTPGEAEKAIVEPAQLSDVNNFSSATFSYDDHTLDIITKKLSGEYENEESYNPDMHGIDGSQLQKICSHIEKKVITRQDQLSKKEGDIYIDEKVIKNEKDIDLILDEYYTQQLHSIGNKKEIALAKNIIEEYMIAGDSRTFITHRQMEEYVKGNPGLIEKMLKARLIKEEHIHLGKGYELSHDSLVDPVKKYKQEKDSQRTVYKVITIWSAIIFLACIILLFPLFLFFLKSFHFIKIN